MSAPAAAGRSCSSGLGRAPSSGSSTAGIEVPAAGEPVAGGTAKFQKLATRFPNCPTAFSLLYLGSSALPRDLDALLSLARRRGIPVVVNQDGVGYPGWAGHAHGRGQSPAAARPARRDPRAVPERVLPPLGGRVPRPCDGIVGDPLQRGRSRALHACLDRAGRRAGRASRRRSDPGLPLRARACRRCASSSRTSPTRRSSSPAGRRTARAPASASSASAGAST